MILRPARVSDTNAIVQLINSYATDGLLLPRSHQSVCEHLLALRIIEEDGVIVGTAGLHILGDDMAEIRSLAIAQSAQGKGYGRLLVDTLFAEAESLEIPKVLVLTYQTTFFNRCGFTVIEKMTLQKKIWKDCKSCNKFPVCDEIAMIKNTCHAPVPAMVPLEIQSV